MGWWQNATTEQRLEQVKGCIECGMTCKAASITLGVTYGALSSFAEYHGLRFARGRRGYGTKLFYEDGRTARATEEILPVDRYLNSGYGLGNRLAWRD